MMTTEVVPINVVYFILFLLAVLCFFGAVFGASIKRSGQAINLTALGLAFFALVPLIMAARTL